MDRNQYDDDDDDNEEEKKEEEEEEEANGCHDLTCHSCVCRSVAGGLPVLPT